jgi:hypothetical protein
MGGFLEIKFVKPTKVVSRTAYQSGIDKFLLSQAKAYIWATGTWILREPDAAVGQELGRFDPSDGVVDETAKLLALFAGDGCPKVLDLNQSFANEDDLGNIGDAGDPAVAD